MPDYTCECCHFTTTIKTHLTRHESTEKHLLRKSGAAITAAKLLEHKMESKKIQEELKSALKEELKILSKQEEDCISWDTVSQAVDLWTFMQNIADRIEVEYFDKIQKEETTYEDLLLQEIAIEFEKNKSIVLEKGSTTHGIFRNKSGVLIFDLRDTHSAFDIFCKLIPLYHKHLKQWAYENGRWTDEFILLDKEVESIKKNIKDLITIRISYDKRR